MPFACSAALFQNATSEPCNSCIVAERPTALFSAVPSLYPESSIPNINSLAFDAVTLTVAGTFVYTTGDSVTLNGTASANVTAQILTYVEVLGSTVTAGTVLNTWIASIASTLRAYCVANSLNYTAYANGASLILSRTHVDTSLPFGNLAIFAVMWSFVGIRKSSGFQEDIANIKPLQLLGVGVVMALLFVIGLIVVVNLVVAS